MPGQTIQIFLKGYLGKTLTFTLQEDSPITELFCGVTKDTGIDADNIKIIYGIKQLQTHIDGKTMTLQDYGIGNLANLTGYVCLPGGWDNVEGHERKVLDDDVELTNAPDMVSLDDDPNSPRAKMPCGHAIGPESLTAYCRSLLTAGKYEFRCPYNEPYCGELWDYITVRKLAVLTTEEKEYFEINLSNNYLKRALGIQECPKCSSYCQRQDKKNPRVVCLICSKGQTIRYEFCWYCRKVWSTSGTKDCGNPSCDGTDSRLKVLQKARLKTINGVQCPAVRACPACGLLIEHKEACKHMTCICKQKFCFICLKQAVNGTFQCGTSNAKCEVAPTQKDIPGE
ncbi:hypothetical protein ACJMK2_038635 [Sinanodonta woodiana]|uniref:RBR-type E3 ubiquitin transferase n=1 Tax=Sinanodonta woodiana TaxID=1069815 RepID=A0ABD3WAN8_SINWO